MASDAKDKTQPQWLLRTSGVTNTKYDKAYVLSVYLPPCVEGGESVERIDEEAFRYLSLQFKADVLIGATSIGWTDHVGALRGLVQTRTPLGEWKARLMQDPTSFMAAYLGAVQQAA